MKQVSETHTGHTEMLTDVIIGGFCFRLSLLCDIQVRIRQEKSDLAIYCKKTAAVRQ
jgi:hypothetical protein